MDESPILMTPENGQKCCDGTKTQTRRIIQPQPLSISWFEHQNGWCARVRDDTGSAENPAYVMVPCPYGGIGDRLWIRESFCITQGDEGTNGLLYRGQCDEYASLKPIWKPSIHMPRWACRTVVEITSIRVERVQDISQDDCIAEGVLIPEELKRRVPLSRITPLIKPTFISIWESINGPGSWARNDYVWVIGFRKIAP